MLILLKRMQRRLNPKHPAKHFKHLVIALTLNCLYRPNNHNATTAMMNGATMAAQPIKPKIA